MLDNGDIVSDEAVDRKGMETAAWDSPSPKLRAWDKALFVYPPLRVMLRDRCSCEMRNVGEMMVMVRMMVVVGRRRRWKAEHRAPKNSTSALFRGSQPSSPSPMSSTFHHAAFPMSIPPHVSSRTLRKYRGPAETRPGA